MPQLLLSAGDRLRLRFARCGDRWEHTVEMRFADRLVWKLRSEEGMADDDWPPSPPFQSLEMHRQPDGRQFALLVGMAGASHWSASAEADSATERIVFDVACRVKLESRWLGSSYLLSDCDANDAQPRIELLSCESTPAAFPVIVEAAEGRIAVSIADLTGPVPQTVRWKYAISAREPAAQARE